MNIQEEFKDWISDLKEYLMNNETIYSKKIVYSSIKKHFPEFIQKLEILKLSDNFREIMYCILKDVPEIPICPVCKQHMLPLRNYVIGYICKRKDELELYKCYSCGTMKFLYTE